MARNKQIHQTHGPKVWLLWEKICYLCGELIDINDLSLDHITPRSLGGSLRGGPNLDNLAPTHLICNHFRDNKSFVKTALKLDDKVGILPTNPSFLTIESNLCLDKLKRLRRRSPANQNYNLKSERWEKYVKYPLGFLTEFYQQVKKTIPKPKNFVPPAAPPPQWASNPKLAKQLKKIQGAIRA